jgi:hypothetical protein
MTWRVVLIFSWGVLAGAQTISNRDGVRMSVAQESTQPMLHILLPGHQEPDSEINIIFPEHVTVRKHGVTNSAQLYLWKPGRPNGDPPIWKTSARSLGYERDFAGPVHMVAKATLEEDGVLFHYEFANGSADAYDLIYGVTDPRMLSVLHDARLERTYVHHKDGFELLASETPARLTMPLSEWLPSRYLDSYTWAVPAQKTERRDDGIMYYNKSRPVDEPMIATLSTDQKWVVASFTRTTGNVWSNPELTCQHVDPERSMGPHENAALEVKILIFPGTLDQALEKVRKQRGNLK